MSDKPIKPLKRVATVKGGKPTDVPIKIYNSIVTDSDWVPVLAVVEPGILGTEDVFLTIQANGRLVHVAGGEPQLSTADKRILKVRATLYETYAIIFDVPGWNGHTNGQVINTLTVAGRGKTWTYQVVVRK